MVTIPRPVGIDITTIAFAPYQFESFEGKTDEEIIACSPKLPAIDEPMKVLREKGEAEFERSGIAKIPVQ